MAFQGFTQQTVDFMWGIRFNNERGWFMAHKDEYINTFLTPIKELGEQVYVAMHEALPDEPLILKVSRIYRDARRLHGRGPYNAHLWWCIRTGDKDWTGRPTFWFELGPDYYSFGLGFWAPAPALMETYRKEIDRHPEALSKLVRQFNRQSTFTLEGGRTPAARARWTIFCDRGIRRSLYPCAGRARWTSASSPPRWRRISSPASKRWFPFITISARSWR